MKFSHYQADYFKGKRLLILDKKLCCFNSLCMFVCAFCSCSKREECEEKAVIVKAACQSEGLPIGKRKQFLYPLS